MIGNRIKQFREREGLTQQELSEKLNIARSTLASYERETREPSVTMLQQIADFFCIDMNALAGKENAKSADGEMVSINSNKPPIPDDELEELLYTLSNRSDLHMLFSLAKDASPEDVRVAAELIKNLRGRYNE